ncbi:hypothetical protein [Sphingobacterium cellulitidis]|uniref:hypothetical protein n=1 Tax=Sphingobacterium cellulitidis TaxID=1768011 RepID=UPI003C7CF17C
MEDNIVYFDKDTPKIEQANKVRSLLAVNGDDETIGSVEFDLLVLEAGKNIGEAVKIDGLVLPTLGAVNKKTTVRGGATGKTFTYTDPDTSQVTTIEVGVNMVCDLFWDASVKTWSKINEDQLPGNPATNDYDINSELPMSGKGVGAGISKNFAGGEGRIAAAEDVKDLNNRANFVDRPDLKNKHFITDSKNKVIDRFITEKSDGFRLLPDGMSIKVIDRPDLESVILVDKHYRLLSSNITQEGGNKSSNNEGLFFPVYNPPIQQSFNIPAAGDLTIIGNYDALITAYDTLISSANINPNIAPYMSRESIGVTKIDSHNIFKYSLKPPSAKHKILLIAGTHANEKMYLWVLYEFIKDIVRNWTTHPFLEYLRWNVQIDVLPCRSPYTLANNVRKRGFRVIPETPPVPFSWTKSGMVVTLTFNIEDFPDDGYLSGDSYFNSVPASELVNKSSLGIISCSDELAIPLSAYRIRSVLAGNSITFSTMTGGNESGTGTFQVWTDPNRNMNIDGSSAWGDFIPSSTIQPNDAGDVIGFYDNKGTRPLSVIENRFFVQLLESEKYDYVMDMHAPANDNDLRFDASTGLKPNIQKILAESGAFNSTSGSNIVDYTNTNNPMPTVVVTKQYKSPMQTIEWGSGLYSANGEQVRDAYRWLGIVLKEVLTNLKKK